MIKTYYLIQDYFAGKNGYPKIHSIHETKPDEGSYDFPFYLAFRRGIMVEGKLHFLDDAMKGYGDLSGFDLGKQ